MKKYIYWDQENIGDVVMQSLQQNKLIVGTSDTIIGFLAPLTLQGKKLLDHVKKRERKPYIVLVATIEKAAQFSSMILNVKLQPLLKASWPGPLTIIVPASKSVPAYLQSTGTIALRVPRHYGLQQVLQRCDGLFSTSANISGDPVPTTVDELNKHIIDHAALIIDDREKTVHKPSTIIDATGTKVKLVRQGELSRAFLEKYVALTE